LEEETLESGVQRRIGLADEGGAVCEEEGDGGGDGFAGGGEDGEARLGEDEEEFVFLAEGGRLRKRTLVSTKRRDLESIEDAP
jgi:hypothetical protein